MTDALVTLLAEALTEIRSELEAHWSHGEDCAVWATDDETDRPLHDDTDLRHPACDCGIATLLRKADAALSNALEAADAAE